MDRGGQLDHAKAGAEMATGDRDGVDGFLPKLVGDLPDLLDLEPAQTSGVRMVSRRGVLLYAVTAMFQSECRRQDRREMG